MMPWSASTTCWAARWAPGVSSTPSVPDVVLAVDLGTSALKAGLVTWRGEVLAWAARKLDLLLADDGGALQSPAQWWDALVEVTRQLLAAGDLPARAVRAVSCSTQGEGTIPVGPGGEPLMDCITWMDMRGAPYLRRRHRGLMNITGAGLARTLRWIRHTGGMPSFTGKDPAGHMLLVREAYPRIYERTHKFLNVLDWMNHRLTGRFVATYDSILTSWVTDNRDPDHVRYRDDLVRLSGVDRDKLPDIVRCTEVLGPLTTSAAAELGLEAGTPVVAGAIDNTAAAVGSGAVADFHPHLYLGTSSWIAAHVPFQKTDVLAALASVPCAVPGRWLMTALQSTAGGNLGFLADLLCPGTPREEAYPRIDELAAHSRPGAGGVLYTPWIWGERAPVEDHRLRAGFQNISLRTARADMARAVLEGVALNTRWLLEPVERFLGRRTRALNVVGGGAVSRIWCRILADVLGRPVAQATDPARANARGAAFIAAVGLGQLRFADVPEVVRIRETYEPDPGTASIYNGLYARLREVHRAMRGVYHRMNT